MSANSSPEKNRLRLVYIMSYRNASADLSGRMIDYKGEKRYMDSPLEFLVSKLGGELGEKYELVGIIHDDDPSSNKDCEALKEYGFSPEEGRPWLFPKNLTLPNGTKIISLISNIPSEYRKLGKTDPDRAHEKRAFESALIHKLEEFQADVALVDGLLVILDKAVDETSPYYRKILNVHPGITRDGSPYQRRGAYATLDALYGAQGKKVVDWNTRETVSIPAITKTGASLHYVDKTIDAGEVIYDVLETEIDPSDSIFELRWNNFHNSLFPAIEKGLAVYAALVQKGN